MNQTEEISDLINSEFINWLLKAKNIHASVGCPKHRQNCVLTNFLKEHDITAIDITFDSISIGHEYPRIYIPHKIRALIKAVNIVYNCEQNLDKVVTAKEVLDVWELMESNY